MSMNGFMSLYEQTERITFSQKKKQRKQKTARSKTRANKPTK